MKWRPVSFQVSSTFVWTSTGSSSANQTKRSVENLQVDKKKRPVIDVLDVDSKSKQESQRSPVGLKMVQSSGSQEALSEPKPAQVEQKSPQVEQEALVKLKTIQLSHSPSDETQQK